VQDQRIIFFRIGAIGDIIHTLPIIKFAKLTNPNAQVEIIVGSKQIADLINSACDFINKTWLIRHEGPFNKIFNQNFSDEEQVLKDSLESNPPNEFVYLHGNLLKAFFLNYKFFHSPKLKVYSRDKSLSAVANFATCYQTDLKSDLIKNPYEVLDYKVLRIKHIYSEQKYICIVPGVGNLRPHRAYPLSKWMNLIDKLVATTDYFIKVVGGPDEANIAKEIDRFIESKNYSGSATQAKRVENFIGKTSLLQLAKILSQADHVYSADTGTLHIASALGLNISAVFSITSEKRFGPFSPNAIIYKSDNCSCSKSFSNHKKNCSNLINGYSACMWNLEFETNTKYSRNNEALR
jgi:ADP-heptose:LPS heptosyltransferase